MLKARIGITADEFDWFRFSENNKAQSQNPEILQIRVVSDRIATELRGGPCYDMMLFGKYRATIQIRSRRVILAETRLTVTARHT